MNSVGAILRTERERQGRETAEIAEELCITQRYLRAIEKDDLKNLPGTFFYKSFVKQYAAILGVDEKQIQAGVAALTAAEDPLPLPGGDTRYTGGSSIGHAPGPQPDANPSSLPAAIENGRAAVRRLDPIVRDGNRRYFPERRMGVSLAALAGVLLACSGFYAWWNKAPHSSIPPTGSVTADSTSTNPFRTSAQSTSVPAGTASVDVTTSTGPDGLNHVVLHLSATEKTWLSISSDGKQVFSGILQPSETKTLTGLEVAKMKVGNAGGIEVLWNGKPIGPIGPRGQVREVLFTPDNFQILSPIRPL
jgi:transcriptional regulator with XRE-family HTH domain